MVGARLLVAMVLCAAPTGNGPREKALARKVARSVDLFATYTGAWPETLEDLKRKPPEVRFWPEGGFWAGPLPESVRWEKGTVSCGGEETEAKPPSRSPIVPPTARLKRLYSARVQIMLLRASARAFLEEHGRAPGKPADLGEIPKDPWGDRYVVEILKDRVRIRAASFRDRWIGLDALTSEERRLLDEGSRARLNEGEARAIEASLDRMSDDDYETRQEATAELRRWGPAVRPFLEARRRGEKDPFVRRWLARLATHFPALPPAWRGELRPPSTVMMVRVDRAALAACSNNLSQLWKMENIYMSQYGGRMKLMPKETGKDFWLALARTPRPLIDEANLDIFVCPASGEKPAKGFCGYAGPNGNMNETKDYGRFIGMCDDEAHGDSVILLRRSGDVSVSDRDGPDHRRALMETKR